MILKKLHHITLQGILGTSLKYTIWFVRKLIIEQYKFRPHPL